jgi:hypothetical protein
MSPRIPSQVLVSIAVPTRLFKLRLSIAVNHGFTTFPNRGFTVLGDPPAQGILEWRHGRSGGETGGFWLT